MIETIVFDWGGVLAPSGIVTSSNSLNVAYFEDISSISAEKEALNEILLDINCEV